MKRLTLTNLGHVLPDLVHHPVDEKPTQTEHKVLKIIALLEEAHEGPVPFEQLRTITTLKPDVLRRVIKKLECKGMVYRSTEDCQCITHNPKALENTPHE